MPKKAKLIAKLTQEKTPRDFSVQELDQLMNKCGCKRFEGGRGSGIGYSHIKTGRILQFDHPHPGSDLWVSQVKKTIRFLTEIDEIQ